MLTPSEELKLLLNQFADKKVDLDDFKSAAMSLAKNGADLTVRNDINHSKGTLSENTLLHHLILTNDDNRNDNAIAELLQRNKDKKINLVNVTNGNSRTLLQSLMHGYEYGKRFRKIRVSFKGFKSTAMILARNGADLSVLDYKGNTLVHSLVLMDDTEIGKLLELNPTLINARNEHGESPLQSLLGREQMKKKSWAIGAKLREISKKLSIMALYQFGNKKEHAELREFLKSNEHFINYKEGQEVTHESLSTWDNLFRKLAYLIDPNPNNRNDKKISKLLLDNQMLIHVDAVQDPLFEEKRNNKIMLTNGIKRLIQLGSDLHNRDKYGLTLVHTACVHGELDIVQHLVAKGLDVTVKTEDNWTVLHYCAGNSNQELWEWLYEKGADINAKSSDQETVLSSAIDENNTSMVRWLIEKKADLNVKDKNGDTPLSRARKHKFGKIVNLLLNAGALDKKFEESDEMKNDTSYKKNSGSGGFEKKDSESEEKINRNTGNENSSSGQSNNTNTASENQKNRKFDPKNTRPNDPEKNKQEEKPNQDDEKESNVKKQQTARGNDIVKNKEQTIAAKSDLKVDKKGYLATFTVSEEELKARGLVAVIDRMYELYQKINDFDDKLNKAESAKNIKDTGKYLAAKTAAENIHGFMKELIEQHSGDFNEFRSRASCILDEKNSLPDKDREISNANTLREDVALLKTHRGFKKILINLLLIVPYVITAAIKRDFTFFKVSTDAGSKVDKLLNEINNSKK